MLSNSENKLQSILLQLPNPVLVLKGSQFIIELANEKLLQIWGKTAAEVLHQPHFEVLPHYKGTAAEESFRKVFETGEVHISETVPVTFLLNGQQVQQIHKVLIQPLWNDAGQVEGIMATGYDITNEVQARKKFEENELRFRVTFDNAAVGIAHVGLDGSWLDVNERLCQIVGCSKKELLSSTFQDITHPDDLDADLAFVEQMLRGEIATYSMEKRYLHKNGSIVWVNLTVSLVHYADGKPNFFISVVEDISQRKQVEQRLSLAQSAGKAGLFELQFDPNKAFVTGFLQQICGANAQTGEINLEKWNEIIDKEDNKRVIGLLQEAFRQQLKELAYEFRVHVAGEELWLAAETHIEYNAAGRALRIIGINYDITERKKVEASIKESESRFRHLADNAPVMIWVTDHEGYCTYLNKQWLDFTGQTLEEAKGFGWLKAIHPDDQESTGREFMEASAKGAAFYKEYRLRNRVGNYEWMIDSAVPRTSDEGVFLGYIGSVVNIHYRKLAEEELKKLSYHLELSTIAAGVGTWSLDIASGNLEWSKLHKKMWGYDETKSGLSYKDWYSLILPEDVESAIRRVEEARKSGLQYENEYRIKRAGDGAIRWIRSFGRFFYSITGEPGTLNGITMDVTEHKKAEAAIRESEARYRELAQKLEVKVEERANELQQSQAFLQSVLDTTQNGIATYQPIRNEEGKIHDFRIAFINYMVTKDLGLLPAEIINKTVSEVFPNTIKDGSFERLVQFVETGEGSHYEIEHLVGDGTILYFDIMLSRMGEGVTVTVRNITEQKRAARQLQELNKELQLKNMELERSNTDLQQFAHVASHDLKEPVRKIRTFGSRLIDEFQEELPEKAKAYLSKIESASSRIYEMIEGVLLYSSFDAAEQTMTSVPLSHVLEHIEGDLEVLIAQKKARIERGPLPEVKGIPVLLYQLFYNLLNNALKFTKKGVMPVIKVWGEPHPAEGGKSVQLFVEDNGIGFEADQAVKIFDTFSRLHSKDQFEGTGLGLSLCKKIVERHGGSIRAEGKEGQGARFVITLPVPEKEL